MTKIQRLKLAVDKAEAKLVEAISLEQQSCSHDDLAEYFSSPPLRICCKCGMREVGWGPGYIVMRGLSSSLMKQATDLYMTENARGLYINSDDKSLLLRKETTLESLVQRWQSLNTPESVKASLPKK